MNGTTISIPFDIFSKNWYDLLPVKFERRIEKHEGSEAG
jgi:hypothetical protein